MKKETKPIHASEKTIKTKSNGGEIIMKNKNSFFKQILSIMLVVCMMAAFIPAAFATGDAETGVKVVYDFDGCKHKEAFDNSITYANSVSKGRFAYGGTNEATRTTEFRVVESYEEIADSVPFLNIAVSDTNYWAMKIRMPKNKSYNVAVNYVKANNNPLSHMDTDIWIFPATADIEAAIKAADTAMVTISATTGLNKSDPAVLGTESGTFSSENEEEYFLVFKRRNTDGTGNQLRLFSVELSEIDTETGAVYENLETVPFYGTVSAESNTLTDDTKSTTLSVSSVYMSDGTEAPEGTDLSGITYESSDESVIQINGRTATGTDTGTATISAYLNGVCLGSVDMESSVTPKTGVKVVYDFEGYVADTPLQAITYENSGGRMEYKEKIGGRTDSVKASSYDKITEYTNFLSIQNDTANGYSAMKIRMPKNKSYNVAVNYVKANSNPDSHMDTGIWILPAATEDIAAAIKTAATAMVTIDAEKNLNNGTTPVLDTESGTFSSNDEEEYLLVFKRLNAQNGTQLRLLSVELSEIDTDTGLVCDNLEEVSFEPEVETVSQSVYRLTTVLGDEAASSSTLPVAVDIIGGYATVSAAETDEGGNTFLYWAKGLQTGVGAKVLSTNHEEYKFKPSNGANYIIAVYGKPAEEYTPKYFNANGQPLKNGDEEVSMPGYGTTNKFKDCGFGVYIAEYDSADEETYTITVNNGTGPTEPVNFGDEVTVKATVPEGKHFHFWQKKGEDGKTEVVSFEETYIFYAFENCEVTAVYNTNELNTATAAEAFRKIILTNIGGNQFMTEFIGFEDAVEKGIAIGNNRIAMTTDATQFTLNVDEKEENASVKGYAIDTDGKVYYAD